MRTRSISVVLLKVIIGRDVPDEVSNPVGMTGVEYVDRVGVADAVIATGPAEPFEMGSGKYMRRPDRLSGQGREGRGG
jgi:hypothetical protein